jgi:histidine triad (HIT) family protein
MYNHEPRDYLCPFCALAGGRAGERVLSTASDIVYAGRHVTAFVGSHQWPQNPGNVIVIPNDHFENLYNIPLLQAARVQELVQAVACAMKVAWDCDGVSTRQHNEPAGNQDVWHYHVHVTPGYHGDGFYHTERYLMPAEERARYAAELRLHLAGWQPAAGPE